jgi:hypothetical protein
MAKSKAAGAIRGWHGGQLVIAWIALCLGELAIVGGYFGMLGVVGHKDWPSEDRRPCLRPADVLGLRLVDPEYHLRLVRLAAQVHTNSSSIDQSELLKQLGFSWLPDDPYSPKQPFTAASDTSRMLADLVRFETYPDSLDTLVQNAYLAARGLRLDRTCVTAHYAAINRRIALLGWLSVALVALVPFGGLWMTWIWFGGRVRTSDATK